VIHLTWVYKDSPIQKHSFDVPFDTFNCHKVVESIKAGEIPKPENYDKYLLTEEEITGYTIK